MVKMLGKTSLAGMELDVDAILAAAMLKARQLFAMRCSILMPLSCRRFASRLWTGGRPARRRR